MLVATTVIEVGIDVPNATVMVVDHAERFGLAQLHQLRGRVGRGAAAVALRAHLDGSSGASGLRALEAPRARDQRLAHRRGGSRDRGPGDLLGLRQAGLPDFRAANLVRDVRLLEEARREAEAHLVADPGLRARGGVRQVLEHRWRGRLGLAQVG